MADIFGGVAAPRLNWSQPTSSAQTAQIILAARAQGLREQEYQRQLEEDRRQQEAIHGLVGSLHAAGVNDEATMAEYVAKNPEAVLNRYTGPLVKQLATTFSTFARIKEASTASVLQRKSAEWQQQQNQEVFQAAPQDYPKLTATFDENGRWTEKTSEVYATLKPSIDEYRRQQALLKPQVISAQTAADSREEVARINNEARVEINQSTLDWKSKHQFSRAMPFIEHAQLAEIKGDIANINMLDKAATTGGGDDARMEAQKAKIRYHNKWDPILKEAATRANQTEATPPIATEQKPNVTKDEYDKLKSGDLYWWNGKQIPKQ